MITLRIIIEGYNDPVFWFTTKFSTIIKLLSQVYGMIVECKRPKVDRAAESKGIKQECLHSAFLVLIATN